jgi:putative ABC transport system permease protein
MNDLRFACRQLLKNPGFTAVAVLTLALGIGANTAIFSVVNAVLLQPPPFERAHELMLVWADNAKQGLKQFGTSFPNYADWRDQNSAFEELAAANPDSFNFLSGVEPERVFGAHVTANLFSTFKVEPLYGRSFLAGEDKPGNNGVVILSEAFWRRRFGGDTNVLGRSVTLNSRAFTVVGIMPGRLRFPYGAEIWIPLSVEGKNKLSRGFWWLTVIGRLRPGVTQSQAQAEMNTIAHRLEQQYPETHSGWRASLMPLQAWVVGSARAGILLFFLAGIFVLLIAGANVANLQMIRAVERQKEFSLRAALGASRTDLVRQLLSENLVLFMLGGFAGFVLAWLGIEFFLKAVPSNIPRIHEVRMDGLLFCFTVAVAIGSGLLFGLLPALRGPARDLYGALKNDAKTTSGGWDRQRLRSLLVASEIALALMLLVTSGLLIQSFWRMQRVSAGFDSSNVMVARIALPETRYGGQPQQADFYNGVLKRVQGLPGVRAAGLATTFPLSGGALYNAFIIRGEANQDYAKAPSVLYNPISPEYFATLRIPLLKGRRFTDRDDKNAAPVAIVNQSLARRFFPGEDALGKRISIEDGKPELWCEIVGVVGDVKQYGLNRDPLPEIYLPFEQRSRRWMTLFVHTENEPGHLAAAVRKAVTEVDREQPLHAVSTLEKVLFESVGEPRFRGLLISALAILALVLSAIGIYGVVSFSVSRRTREIGIRTALGAPRRSIFSLIVRKFLWTAGFGIAAGWLGAFAIGRSIHALLFEVRSADLLTFAGVTLLLICTVLAACAVPARRATKVDPMEALRYE